MPRAVVSDDAGDHAGSCGIGSRHARGSREPSIAEPESLASSRSALRAQHTDGVHEVLRHDGLGYVALKSGGERILAVLGAGMGG